MHVSLRSLAGLALTLALVAPGTARASADGDDPPPDTPYWRTNLFKRFALDQKFLVTQWFPNELRRPAFTAPLVGAVLLAARSSDESGVDRVQQADIGSDAPPAAIRVSHGLTTIGNGPVVAAALGLTYLASRRAGNDHLAATASLSGEAMLSVALWSEVLKAATARMRPGPESTGRFFQYGEPRTGSFPSGHAMLAFSIASVFSGEYRSHTWVPWVAYGTAGLIGAARISVGQHYPSDVIFGAVLGHSIGQSVLVRQGEAEDAWYLHLQPVYDDHVHAWGVGYGVRW